MARRKPQVDLGWVAGVIDARGHITVRPAKEARAALPNIRITTRHRELLEALAAMTGTNVVTDQRPYDRRPCGDHCSAKHQHAVRQSSFWQVNGGRATIVLFNVRPLIRAKVTEVRDALLAGMDHFDPKRNGTGAQMVKLGWELPS